MQFGKTENSQINISFKHISGKLLIEIQDNGLGIPIHDSGKIFDKFYRVPGSRTGGTGLGLSIVKSIIELHKGKISFENVLPHGALFKIEMPLESQPNRPHEES